MIVERCMGNSPIPQLTDPAVRQRAAAIAAAQGLLERIERDLDAGRREIPVVSHSLFRRYRRTGNRTDCEALLAWRSRQTELAAIACWLGMDRWDWLQDLLWADCECTWWIYPAHEAHSHPIDLFAAIKARQQATILRLLEGRLDREVAARVKEEIHRRVLSPFLDPARQDFFWKTTTTNWNAVCHAGVALAAMLVEDDPRRLDATIRMVLRDLGHFLDGFTPDGGCTEGPSYWRFGFGWYVALAAGLYDFTGGRINLMTGERVARICRYPLAVTVRPGVELEFADAHGGYQSPETAILVNRFVDVPELFGLCRLTADGSLAVEHLSDLLLYDGRKHPAAELRNDVWLKDLGVVKAYTGELAVGAKAGHNAEHHNHNDVGSLIVYRGGAVFLCDPGAPIYSARTFSEKRYESVYVNSFGHSVPVIEGAGQGHGRQFAGTIAAEGLGGVAGGGASRAAGEADGPAKRVRIEMAGAYPVPILKRLTRLIELSPGGKEMALTDSYEFCQAPSSVQEAFMTTLPAEASADGRSVVIRSESAGAARLTARAEGSFAVRELTEESKAESRTGQLLRRILFTPAKLADRMELGFVVKFE